MVAWACRGWEAWRGTAEENQVGDAPRLTRWSTKAAGVRVVAERKRGLNPPGETSGTRHAAEKEVIERVWEWLQAGVERWRETKP